MADSPDHTEPNRWAILALLGVAQLMVVLVATIVNIALPSCWWPRGRYRGVFGALLATSALSLLTVTFSGSPDRPKAFGIFGAIAGGGASVGLLLGGALTQTLSWRWCLYVNLAIAVPTAILALRLLVNQTNPQRPRIDVPGVLVASAGLLALVYGFSNAETNSRTAAAPIIALVASPLLLIAFVLIERRTPEPLLPLHVVWDRARGGAYASIALAGSGVFGVFLVGGRHLRGRSRGRAACPARQAQTACPGGRGRAGHRVGI